MIKKSEPKSVKSKVVAKTIRQRAKLLSEEDAAFRSRVLTPEVMQNVREALSVSQSVIARDLQVSINAYRQWEQGMFYPSDENYKMLQDYFCIFNEEDIEEALLLKF